MIGHLPSRSSNQAQAQGKQDSRLRRPRRSKVAQICHEAVAATMTRQERSKARRASGTVADTGVHRNVGALPAKDVTRDLRHERASERRPPSAGGRPARALSAGRFRASTDVPHGGALRRGHALEKSRSEPRDLEGAPETNLHLGMAISDNVKFKLNPTRTPAWMCRPSPLFGHPPLGETDAATSDMLRRALATNLPPDVSSDPTAAPVDRARPRSASSSMVRQALTADPSNERVVSNHIENASVDKERPTSATSGVLRRALASELSHDREVSDQAEADSVGKARPASAPAARRTPIRPQFRGYENETMAALRRGDLRLNHVPDNAVGIYMNTEARRAFPRREDRTPEVKLRDVRHQPTASV